MAEWIVAVCAVIGLLGGLIVIWVGVRSDIAVLQATVSSLDREMARMARELAQVRTLLITIVGGAHTDLRTDSE